MANVHAPVKVPGKHTPMVLDTTEAGIVLRNNLDPYCWYGIGTCKLTVRGTGWTGAITVKKRIAGGTASGTTCIYQNANTDTTVGAGTTITADGDYYIRADADDVILDYAHTAGSVAVDYAFRVG